MNFEPGGLALPLRVARVFAPFALGYVLSFMLRSVAAILAPDIMTDIGVGPAALGVLTSSYFLGYAAMQLPAGILLDRFGPRRTDAALMLIGALGAVAFALADDIVLLGAGRFVIGIGMSACLLAGYKANAMWFAPSRLAFLNGLLMAFGAAGASLATLPAALVIDMWGWRGMMLGLAALVALSAIVMVWIVPDRDVKRGRGDANSNSARRPVHVSTGRALALIIGDPLFVRMAPVTVMTQATLLAYQSLWAGPWLAEVTGREPLGVANHLLAISMAMMLGFPVIGAAATAMERFGVASSRFMAGGISIFLIAQCALVSGSSGLALPGWILFGGFGAASILTYTILILHLPGEIGGRALGLLNFLVFAVAFMFQSGIGHVIAFAGADAAAHLFAQRIVLAVQVIAFAWFFLPIRGGQR